MVDLHRFLAALGLEQYARVLAENDVDLDVLPDLSDDDLKELGLSLGHRRRLRRALTEAAGATESAADTGDRLKAHPAEAERRQLTVLLCDLVGSTALTARHDLEEIRELVAAYQGACAGVIERFDGHVAKYMGDGLLAYFGWPRAHEDDAERAVRAGLELTAVVASLRAPDDTPLAVRVGIATGLVVVGDLIGEGAAQEEAVIGETPNLAARLQGLAAPGAVVIGPGTRRLIGTTFDLEDLGERELKGLAAPVPVWRVVGSGRAETRFEAARGRGLSPFIGREQEVELLLERWRQAGSGEGQVVLLAGEAGVGKSRILEALRERLDGQPHRRLRFQCSSFRTNSPLYPIIAHLQHAAAIAPGDPAAHKLQKLDAVLAEAPIDRERVLPLLAGLMSIPFADEGSLAEMSAQERRNATAEALIAQILALAGREPVLVLFEDAHWIDPTTEELLHGLIDRLRDSRVLMIVTFRPEYRPSWGDHSHVTWLVLNRLGRTQCAALVRAVAGGRDLAPEALDHIVDKTDGVPLFVEELTKAVLESGLLVEEGARLTLKGPLAIPATLQDSLMARLDRMAPVKEVANIGACIGRQFSRRLLSAVSRLGAEELDGALDQLLDSGLVFRRGSGPEATYVFKHALVQDVAHGTLLRSRRQQIHFEIAQAMLELNPERAESEPELLAQHFAEAGRVERAIEFREQAGARAVARCANAEAVAHFEAAIAALQSLPPSRERDRRELLLRVQLSVPLIALHGFGSTAVEQCALDARELSDALGLPDRRFAVLRVVWNSSLMRRPHAPTYALACELMAFAEQNGDPARLAVAHRAKGYSEFFLGRYSDAEATLGRGIELAADDIPPERFAVYGEHPAILCRVYRGWALAPLGRAGEATAMAAEGIALARRLRNPHAVAWALCCGALVHAFLREAETALPLAEEAQELATTYRLPQWRAWSTFFAGWARSRIAEPAAGLEMMEDGARAWRATGAALSTTLLRGLLAEAHARQGDHEQARAHLDAAFAHCAAFDEAFMLAELHRIDAAVCDLEQRPADVVRDALAKALQVACAQGVIGFAARAACARAVFERAQGRRDAARSALDSAIAGPAADCPDLVEARALMAELVG